MQTKQPTETIAKQNKQKTNKKMADRNLFKNIYEIYTNCLWSKTANVSFRWQVRASGKLRNQICPPPLGQNELGFVVSGWFLGWFFGVVFEVVRMVGGWRAVVQGQRIGGHKSLPAMQKQGQQFAGFFFFCHRDWLHWMKKCPAIVLTMKLLVNHLCPSLFRYPEPTHQLVSL